jgi:hypothetical protein
MNVFQGISKALAKILRPFLMPLNIILWILYHLNIFFINSFKILTVPNPNLIFEKKEFIC